MQPIASKVNHEKRDIYFSRSCGLPETSSGVPTLSKGVRDLILAIFSESRITGAVNGVSMYLVTSQLTVSSAFKAVNQGQTTALCTHKS